MALRPCSFGTHRFPGKAGTVYPAILRGGDTLRWKFWTCPKHAVFVDEALAPYEIKEDPSAFSATADENTCLTCGSSTDGQDRDLVFVTTYFSGQDRRDFTGVLHKTCGRPGFLPE